MTTCKRIVKSALRVGVFLCASIAFSQATTGGGSIFLNIDHVSVCGSDLDAMRQAFTSVGLTTEYGGPHASGGTHMALLGFEDGSYLELIAPKEAGATGNGWAKLMAGNAGPCAWAVEPKDIDAEVARLKTAGMSVEGPTLGSRKKPDGLAVEWDVANVGTGAPGSKLPFLIQDRTPRTWRVEPSNSTKGTGLSGLEMVVLAVNDLNTGIALFRKAYGWAEPLTEEHSEFEAKLAYFPGEPVILAAPLGGHSWISDRLQKFGESPAAYLLTTQDLNSTMKKVRLSGTKNWFGQRVTWFDAKKLNGTRLGVIGQ